MRDGIQPERLTRSPRARPLAAAALASGVLVAACGGSSGSPSVASVGSSTASSSTVAAASGTPSPGSTPQGDLGPEELAFAQCMRSSGEPDFPDPNAGGGFEFRQGAGADPQSAAFKAAQAKCQKLMPGGAPPRTGSTTGPSTRAVAQMLKVSQCMRRHGIPGFPDPRTTVPSNLAGLGEVADRDGVILVIPRTLDAQSPAYTQAAATCGFQLRNH